MQTDIKNCKKAKKPKGTRNKSIQGLFRNNTHRAPTMFSRVNELTRLSGNTSSATRAPSTDFANPTDIRSSPMLEFMSGTKSDGPVAQGQ